MYQALKAHYPAFDHPKLSPETLWPKVYPEKPFVDQHFWRLSSNLSKLVEKFLVHLEAEREEERLLIRNLLRREDYELFESKARQVIGEPANREVYSKYLDLERLRLNHVSRNRFLPGDVLPGQIMDALDYRFVRDKLRLAILMLSRQRVYKTENYRIAGLRTLIDLPMPDSPTIELYKMGVHLLLEDEQVDINEYLQHLKLADGMLPFEELRLLFYNGLNYCWRKSNGGDWNYTKVLADWYKFGEQSKLITLQNTMTYATMINAVSIFGIVGRVREGREFLLDNIKYIKEDAQKDMLRFGQGMIFFYEGKFENALQNLMRSSKITFVNKILLRNLIVRATFELFVKDQSYNELLQSRLNSYETFLNRHYELADAKLENAINLIKILQNCAKLVMKTSDFREAQQWLKNSIGNYERVASRHWIHSLIEREV